MDYVFKTRPYGLPRFSLGMWACGVFIVVLRRMSLMGDALAILPGAAFGFFSRRTFLTCHGGAAGFLVGFLVALLAGAISRFTILNEDASFAGFYT